MALAVQHYFIYAALETAAEAMREDPMAAPFVDDALHRLATLEADLTFLVGPDWAEKISPIPATAAYAARIRETCATSATAYIAHHYTRYIGDLSGGVMIGRVVNRTFGLVDGVGGSSTSSTRSRRSRRTRRSTGPSSTPCRWTARPSRR